MIDDNDLRADDAPLPTAVATDGAEDQAPGAGEHGEPATAASASSRPDGVPEKFWDPEAGAVRTEALLKSYRELERKLGRMVPLPADETDSEGQARLRRALGVPDSVEGYQIQTKDELIQPDPALNARLLEAGFSQRQAQMVYDLAAEYVLPLVDQAVAGVAAERDVERLADHFGSAESWRAVAEQIKTWGKANLPEDTMQVLASSFEGVLAMHHMMRASEPSVVQGSEAGTAGSGVAGLREMMRDPRYWRDRDPAHIARVTEGFNRLYSR